MTESEVVESVVSHFKSNKYPIPVSIKRKLPVKMGSSTKEADIAFMCDNGILVIIECKSSRNTGKSEGIPQLWSYLCATDTLLGIFAASTSQHEWKFYENLTRNTFVEIDYDRFKKLLLNQMRQYTIINERAEQRFNQLIEQSAQKRLTEERIQRATTQLVEKEVQKRINANSINDGITHKLNNRIENLKQQLKDANTRCIWGWVLFGIAVLIIISIASSL